MWPALETNRLTARGRTDSLEGRGRFNQRNLPNKSAGKLQVMGSNIPAAMNENEVLEPSAIHHTVRPGDWDQYQLTDELEIFVREVGTPDEIEARRQRLLVTFHDTLKTIPPDALTDEQGFFVRETLSIITGHLEKLREKSEWAVAMLFSEGWRFNRMSNRLERIQGQGRLRRQRFTDDVVTSFKSSGADDNSRAVRVLIADALKNAYPKEMLSARAYFPIWQSLKQHLDGAT